MRFILSMLSFKLFLKKSCRILPLRQPFCSAVFSALIGYIRNSFQDSTDLKTDYIFHPQEKSQESPSEVPVCSNI